MKTVLVTGATGFVGRFLCRRLLDQGFKVRGTLLPQEPPSLLFPGVQAAQIEPLGADTEWGAALEGVDGVIHLAAPVHIMNDLSTDPLAEFRKVNVAGSKRLAAQAPKGGVMRMVFVSYIKVNGEASAQSYTAKS